jgi:hypothetical protein
VANFEVNAGSLPKGAREFAPRYRFLGDQTWIDLPRENSPRFTIDVLREKGVGEERFELDVRAVSHSGIVAPRGRRISLRTDAPIADIDDPSDLTLPTPKILQEDAALAITPDKPFGAVDGAYEIEVRHSVDGDNPEDAVQVGYVEPGDTVKDYAWSDEEDQQIHTRLIRKEDNKAGAWTTTDFKVSSAADTDTEDFDADFSTGTLEGIGTSSVAALANVVASGVEFVTTITLDSFGSTTLDQLGTASLDMVDGTPSQGTWTSPVYELSDPQPFQLEIKPEKDTITRQTKTLDDLGAEPLCPPPTLAGVAQDNRLRDSSFVLDGDEYPIVVETKIAVSDATGPTFVDADFIEAVPGRIYKPLAYAIRFTLFTRFLTQFRLTRIRIRRFLICHCSKKVLKFHITEGTHHRGNARVLGGGRRVRQRLGDLGHGDLDRDRNRRGRDRGRGSEREQRGRCARRPCPVGGPRAHGRIALLLVRDRRGRTDDDGPDHVGRRRAAYPDAFGCGSRHHQRRRGADRPVGERHGITRSRRRTGDKRRE